ncbi:MAG: hypothetical protein H0U74_01270 [Bradymonadaceae bacterium]|nr:hypothetical protein [Lujinxingiaceae bacterium]
MKMKLGDLEMEQGKGISFHQSLERPSAESTAHATTAAGSSDVLAALSAALPKLSATQLQLLSGLAALLALLSVLLGLFSALSWLALVPLPGLGVMAILALVLAQRARRRPVVGSEAGVLTTRKARLLGLMSATQTHHRVEELQDALGWTAAAVVTTLQALVEEQQVVEDLDLETGHWNYLANSAQWQLDLADPRSLPIAERALALQATQTHED